MSPTRRLRDTSTTRIPASTCQVSARLWRGYYSHAVPSPLLPHPVKSQWHQLTRATAFQEIVALSQGTNKVLAVTSGHDHGESWCARSKDSSGISLW
jgi:hypothetical protein